MVRRKIVVKKIDYKGNKWDKRKEYIAQYVEWGMGELNSFEEKYQNSEVDVVRYHYVKAQLYYSFASDQYILENTDKSKQYMEMCVDEFVKSCEYYKRGVQTLEGISNNIHNAMTNGAIGYCTVALNRELDIKKIMYPDSILMLLVNEKYDKVKEKCQADETINNLMIAICEKDNEKFERGLECRIKEIRRAPVDRMAIIDIWAVAMVKIARKRGMDFYCNYIEVPDFLLE